MSNTASFLWIILEVFINTLDSFLILCLITSSLNMKRRGKGIWVVSTLILSIICSLTNKYCTSVYQMLLILTTVLFAFTLFFTQGNLTTKIFWTVFTQILFFGNDMLQSTLVLTILHDVPSDIIYQQGAVRLFLMVITRATLIIVIFWLRKKRLLFSSPIKQTLMLILCPLLSWLSLLLLTNLFAKDHLYDSYVIMTTVLICAINAVYVYLFVNLKTQNRVINENSLIIQRLEADKRHYESVKLYDSHLSEWKHDINKHLQAIVGLIQNGSSSQAIEYITKIEGVLFATPQPISTGNALFDSLVGSYCSRATNQEIQVSLELMVPSLDFMDEIDMCSIVGNMWENAIEGCLRTTCEPKQILFKTSVAHNHFMMEMTNSYNKTDQTASKTEPGHGLGLKIIERILDKNDGFCSINTANDTFSIHVAIPCNSTDYTGSDKTHVFFWKNY